MWSFGRIKNGIKEWHDWTTNKPLGNWLWLFRGLFCSSNCWRPKRTRFVQLGSSWRWQACKVMLNMFGRHSGIHAYQTHAIFQCVDSMNKDKLQLHGNFATWISSSWWYRSHIEDWWGVPKYFPGLGLSPIVLILFSLVSLETLISHCQPPCSDVASCGSAGRAVACSCHLPRAGSGANGGWAESSEHRAYMSPSSWKLEHPRWHWQHARPRISKISHQPGNRSLIVPREWNLMSEVLVWGVGKRGVWRKMEAFFQSNYLYLFCKWFWCIR